MAIGLPFSKNSREIFVWRMVSSTAIERFTISTLQNVGKLEAVCCSPLMKYHLLNHLSEVRVFKNYDERSKSGHER